MFRAFVLLLTIGLGTFGGLTPALAQAQHPPPRPLELSQAPGPAAPVAAKPPEPTSVWADWDPRWVGIVISGLLGVISIAMQLILRWSDKRRAKDEAEFDQEIGDPLRDCYPDLRALNSACSALPGFKKAKDLEEALKKIIEEKAPQALSPFATGATNADRLLKREIFSQFGSDLEDVIYPELETIKGAADARVKGIAQKKIAKAIADVMFQASKELRRERKRYRCTKN